MIDIRTGWDRPYRPLQGTHGAAFMIELEPVQDTGSIPVNLHIILDISGSMNVGSKLSEAKKACCFIIDQLQDRDTLSITAFNDNIQQLMQNTLMTAENKDKAKELINSIDAQGVTRLDLAFDHLLSQSVPGASFAILISDGRPTDKKGKRISDTSYFLEQAGRIGETGVKMIVAALGDPAAYEADFFNSLAQRTGGPFRFSPFAEDLENILKQDITIIQNTSVRGTTLEFNFYRPNTKLIWFGRAYPDKQFLEPHNHDFHFSIGILSQGEPQTFVAYIMTTGDISTTPGQYPEGEIIVQFHTDSGSDTIKKDIVVEYTANPDHLSYTDMEVNKWRLELDETGMTMKGIESMEKGDLESADRHFKAARRTREELGKDTHDLEQYRKTKKEDDPSKLGKLLESARKSKRPEIK